VFIKTAKYHDPKTGRPAVRGKSHPWPFSTRFSCGATPKKAEVFGVAGRRILRRGDRLFSATEPPQVSEQIGVVLVFCGLFLAGGGLCLLGLRGLGVLLGRTPRRRLLVPLAACGAGLVIGATPIAAQRVWLAVVGLGPRERVVEGRVALTLTGWDRKDYGILRGRTDIEILEMSNPDVTDETLAILAGLPRLREVSLDDSQVGDTGLETLRALPALVTLRLARTRITAGPVEAFLRAAPPGLEQLDVSGNGIPAAPLRAWKNAAPAGVQRRYLN